MIQKIAKDGGIRSAQFGSNINTANIITAMFIATGQDAGSVAEASWSHLTSELDHETKDLTMSLYFPSLQWALLVAARDMQPRRRRLSWSSAPRQG
jgi:hydroxymethylglutaryl-CoA reductase